MGSWLRRLLALLSSAGTASAVVYSGLPIDLAGVLAGVAGQAVSDLVVEGRSVETVRADEANRADRARAYEHFGESVSGAWWNAGMLLQFRRPRIVGYIHPLLMLVRSQKRFEQHIEGVVTSISGVLLYGSTETIEAALEVAKKLSEAFRQTATVRQGSLEMAELFQRLSLDVGDKVVKWRQAAQADLGL